MYSDTIHSTLKKKDDSGYNEITMQYTIPWQKGQICNEAKQEYIGKTLIRIQYYHNTPIVPGGKGWTRIRYNNVTHKAWEKTMNLDIIGRPYDTHELVEKDESGYITMVIQYKVKYL